MIDYSKYSTDKFKCRKCGQKKMYPNESDNKIMGYICTFCGRANYPVRDTLKAKK